MSTIARFSLDQYEVMVRAGAFDGQNRRRVELIHGEIRDMNPIGAPHASIVDILAEWSFESLPRRNVWVRIQTSVGLPELDSEPEPDLAWVRRRSYRAQHPRADDVLLLVEVAESSVKYDCGEKAELYAAAGIKDYWVVDVPGQSIEVFRDPEAGRYRSRTTHRADEEIRPLAFDGISLKPSMLSGEGK